MREGPLKHRVLFYFSFPGISLKTVCKKTQTGSFATFVGDTKATQVDVAGMSNEVIASSRVRE